MLRTDPPGSRAGGCRKPGRGRDRLLRTLLVLLLAPLYARNLASDAITFGDETYWVAHGWKAAQLLFVQRDLEHPYWTWGRDARVLAETELPFFLMPPTRVPKLGLLMIGSSVLLLDAPEPRPRQYDFYRSVAWNRDNGRLPPLATLLAARLPSALLGIVAALCFFSILRRLLPSGWAFAGALLFALNPLVWLYARLATTDVIATSFSVAAILFAIRTCERPERWRPALLAGVLACAAVSSKLNAGILVPILGAALLIEARLRRSFAPLVRGAAAAAIAALLFVGLNPTLYGDPIGGVVSLFRVGAELEDVRLMYSQALLPDVASRIDAARDLLLGRFGMLASRLHVPLDLALLLVGIGVLAWRASREAAARVVLLWIVAAVAAVSLWTPMRFERYYLPAVAPIAAAECVALAFVFQRAVRGVARGFRRAPPGPEPERSA